MKIFSNNQVKHASLLCLIMSINSYASEHSLRIDNVHVLNEQATGFSKLSRVYIENGVIKSIASMDESAQTATQVENAQGGYLVPGFIDLHTHLSASGSTYSSYQQLPIEANLNSQLYYGITSVTDLMMSDEMLSTVKGLDGQYPNVYAAGPAFTNPGGHGTQFGIKAHEVTDLKDVETRWQLHLANQTQLTKAMIETFNGSVTPLSDEVLADLGKRSKAAGLPFFVHVSTLEDGKRAIKAGATALAHGILYEPIDEEFIDLMKSNQVTYIPTLAVAHNHGDEADHQQLSSLDLSPMHAKLKSCLFDKVDPPTGYFEFTWQKKSIAYQNLQKLALAGITIGAGSDAGNPYTPHGSGLITELLALKNAGLNNQTIVQAVTINAAKTLGIAGSYGTLTVGKSADLVLLESNPLQNITALTQAKSVFLAGKKVDRQQLVAANAKMQPQGNSCSVAQNKLDPTIFSSQQNGRNWVAVSDTMFSGSSTTQIERSELGLALTTTLGKPGQYGSFSGAMLDFGMLGDGSDYQGIEIRYQSSHPVYFSVHSSKVKNWDHHHIVLQPSDTLTSVKVPFEKLKQFGFGPKVELTTSELKGVDLLWRLMPGQPQLATAIDAKVATMKFY
ncbi:CIA30 family protein (plasmid) [Pseudoalteromonas sp. T1lg65]|uniref:CIA30 family protein n=1 Tax=Pseudoalteromonas sp. T1lg65 TaxID=2077101 RepID=UPI003F7AA761